MKLFYRRLHMESLNNNRFVFKEKYITKRKINLLILFILTGVMIMAYPLIMDKGIPYNDYMKIAGVIVAFIGLEYLVIAFIIFKKLRKAYLELDDLGLRRVMGKHRRFIYFESISDVKIKRKDDNTEMITIKEGRRKITIYGYEGLEEIRNSLYSNLSADIISDKEMKVDWNNPLLMVIIFLVTFSALMLVQGASFKAYEIVHKLIMFGLAIYFIIFKPLDRSMGGKFARLDIGLGILLIITQLMTLF
jgi:putative effector of murein hydrolase